MAARHMPIHFLVVQQYDLVGPLACTVHLQSKKFVRNGLEADLHRLTADLAVFDVTLVPSGDVDQNAHGFRTERTMDSAFNDLVIHDRIRNSGL